MARLLGATNPQQQARMAARFPIMAGRMRARGHWG